MKKALGIWFAVLPAIVIFVGCSVLPDTKQILGNYWMSAEIDHTFVYTNQGLYTNYTESTNYASKAASEQWLAIDETTVKITELSNGNVVTNKTLTYTLNEEAGTINLTGDVFDTGTSTNLTYSYTLVNGTFTLMPVFSMAISSSMTMTMYITNIFTKE